MTAREHLLILWVAVLFGLPVWVAMVDEIIERGQR